MFLPELYPLEFFCALNSQVGTASPYPRRTDNKLRSQSNGAYIYRLTGSRIFGPVPKFPVSFLGFAWRNQLVDFEISGVTEGAIVSRV